MGEITDAYKKAIGGLDYNQTIAGSLGLPPGGLGSIGKKNPDFLKSLLGSPKSDYLEQKVEALENSVRILSALVQSRLPAPETNLDQKDPSPTGTETYNASISATQETIKAKTDISETNTKKNPYFSMWDEYCSLRAICIITFTGIFLPIVVLIGVTVIDACMKYWVHNPVPQPAQVVIQTLPPAAAPPEKPAQIQIPHPKANPTKR